MDRNLLREKIPEKFSSLAEFWEEAYAVDIAELLIKLPQKEILSIIKRFDDPDQLGQIISYLDYETSHFLANQLQTELLSDILSNMHVDDAADFMGTMPVGTVKELLKLMKEKRAKELQVILEYDEESAGGLMNTEYIAFYFDNTASQVMEKLRQLVSEPEMIYYIYVISRTKQLVGVLSVRQLLAAEPEEQLQNLMNENVIQAEINDDQELVAQILSKYDLLAVPVVNKHNQLMGIITVDDAIDVIEEEATEDIYKMAATSDVYEIRGGVIEAVKKRIPWLLILLIGDLLSGTVIKNFEVSLQAIVALAFFIPVLMDMGGNVGTQSLAVVVRGLGTGDLHFSNFKGHLWQEIKVGLIMAVILGIALSFITILWQGNPLLGLVVGLSMFITLITAVTAGTSIPFIIHSLGADPAIAAGPFITTLIDISGLFIYFTLATMLIEKLL